MRNFFRARIFLIAGWIALAGVTTAWAQQAPTLAVRTLLDGLKQPFGVAKHPLTGELYVSELGSGRILVLRNGRPETVLMPGWTVSTNLPRWAISEAVPFEIGRASCRERV